MKKSFILYLDQEEIIDSLTDIRAGRLFKAIFDYARGDKPSLSPSLSVIFISIRQTLTRDFQKWNNICERNQKNIKKRWLKHTKNTSGKIGIPNAVDNDNDNDNDIYKKAFNEKDKTSGIGYLNSLPLLEQKRLSEIFKTSEQTIKSESEKCYDWLISNGRRQKDYPAFFRNWMRKAIELNPRLKKVDLESLGYKYAKKEGGENR